MTVLQYNDKARFSSLTTKRAATARLNRAFNDTVFNLLFHEDPEYDELQLTESQLLEALEDGEGIYWDLLRDNNDLAILKVIPYDLITVIKNLHGRAKMARDVRFADTFYDFEERVEWR